LSEDMILQQDSDEDGREPERRFSAYKELKYKYLVEWAIAAHGMYESLIFDQFLSQGSGLNSVMCHHTQTLSK
jgi:hypothetical protein